MFGGGDNRGMPIDNDQMHSNSRALVVTVPPTNNSEGQNSPFPGDDMQNGMHQHAGLIVNNSKKLQDDLQELGKKIKHHEDNVNFLKSQKNKLDSSILDMQVAIGKHLTASSINVENNNPEHADSKDETVQNILKHKNSAAALLSQGISEAHVSNHLLIKDVIGVVAVLGKVDDPNLSRRISEYLGLETMLAVVCKTREGVKSLESYSTDGSINEGSGIHAFAASVGFPLDDSFNIICNEDLRPYTGELIADDPQRRLNLLKPRLVNGENPPGFLGFAVNMIMFDNNNLYSVSNSEHTLRETLFYNLLLNTQVYKSREDMLKAIPLIPNGAISLDGGMIKGPGVFSKGHRRRDVGVIFPCVTKKFSTPEYVDIETQLKEAKWKKDRLLEDQEREQQLLDQVRFRYETKKREFVRFLAESSSFATQFQAARVSTPR